MAGQEALSPLMVERVSAALHRRVWSFNREAGKAERLLVMLTDGRAEVEREGGTVTVDGPAIQWIGEPGFAQLRLDPGTTGYVARIGESTMIETVGNRAESAVLDSLTNRSFLLSLQGEQALTDELVRCLSALHGETVAPQSGSQMMVLSYLRIVFFRIARKVTRPQAPHPIGRSDAPLVLQRFRQAVELHFREHWPVKRYAATLGVSHDRLHAICVRELGKTPKTLIGERVIREAAIYLARTMLTTKQISFALGFHDLAHFGNFFKLKTGQPPSAYRRLTDPGRPGDDLVSFADWP